MRPSHLAIDIGAESGRAIVCSWKDGAYATQEVHRFANTPLTLPDGLHWNTTGLLQSVLESIIQASSYLGSTPTTLGIDTWGVDYGLLDEQGALVGIPYHYRDGRTEGMVEELTRRIPKERLYRTAGLQFVPYNTLVQLVAAQRHNPGELARAVGLLTTPDLLNYWLTGIQKAEYTMAATTQALVAGTRQWATDILTELGIRPDLFGEIIEPGSLIGDGPSGVKVAAVASHDTASAAAAVPNEGDDFVWISSGTWSIMGIDSPHPVTTTEALKANLTNEGSATGGVRLCKNIMGLWLVQECRRIWRSEGKNFSYQELADLAEAAEPAFAVVDPDSDAFLRPGDMPALIKLACRESGQRVPETPGQIVRVALESVALKYRRVLENLRGITGRPLNTIHIVGGGCQNKLLNQLTSDICQAPVVIGPIEATALGNLKVQMRACGIQDSLGAEALGAYHPENSGLYDRSYSILNQLANP